MTIILGWIAALSSGGAMVRSVVASVRKSWSIFGKHDAKI